MNQTIERAKEILTRYDGPHCRIMEVCGTHTHEIFRQGIRRILPGQIELISGPGCPVCVTPVGFIDEAIWLALEKGVTVCTFGDLVRVPGTEASLQTARGKGAAVKVVYTPLDAEPLQSTLISRLCFCRLVLRRQRRLPVWRSGRHSRTGSGIFHF